MITGPLKTRIDKLWEEFWTGGITNPLTVIEQISFLAFARLLDIRESTEHKKHKRLHPGKRFRGLFTAEQQELRWSNFKNLGGEAMLPLVRDKVFPHFRKLGEQAGRLGEYMKDAQLMIQKPSLMVSAVNMIDALPLTTGDTKGDLYEYLLSKLTTAGINGQFRTPRHSHPPNGRSARTQTDRRHWRSRLRHRRLLGRRHRKPPRAFHQRSRQDPGGWASQPVP